MLKFGFFVCFFIYFIVFFVLVVSIVWWVFAVVSFISFYLVGVLFCFLEFGWFCYFIGCLFFGGKYLKLGVLGSLIEILKLF